MFDTASFPIECLACGHKFKKQLAWLKTHGKVTCPGCGAVIDAKQVRATLKDLDKTLAKTLRSLGKRR